ncbi:MAG: Transcriptional regulator, TetR family [Parcubacteria bacterium C7867-007]|nr:MAG: Transcriptional regulator, TetR family [Parcubacteria bacterium C7867-007]
MKAQVQPKLSKRQLAKLETQQKVLGAARKLFTEKRYEEVTLRDVVAACGLSTGAVFNSFKDKEELFISISRKEPEGYKTIAKSLGAEVPASQMIIEILEIDYEPERLHILRSQLSCAYAGSDLIGHLLGERMHELLNVLEEFAGIGSGIGLWVWSVHCDICRPMPWITNAPEHLKQDLSVRVRSLFQK